MNLTLHTDYSLRVLILLGSNPHTLYKTKNVCEILDIKLNHATKIIHKLSKLDYIDSFKGKNGGIKISSTAGDTNLATIVSNLEPSNIVSCFDTTKESTCVFIKNCKLKRTLHSAKNAFFNELKSHKLSDMYYTNPNAN